MIVTDIQQIFIKCHDNDFWNYHLHVLKQVYDYIDFFNSKTYDTDRITEFIKNTLDNLYKLHNGDGKFPWEIKVYYNDEAKFTYEAMSGHGNSECAYMDIETYLLTPNATIKQFIFNV